MARTKKKTDRLNPQDTAHSLARLLPCYALLPAAILTDWLTKTWALQIVGGYQSLIDGVLRISVIRQFGGGLGSWLELPAWLQHATVLLSLAALFAIAYITPQRNQIRHCGLACLAGALFSNGGERFLRGFVVDFIEMPLLPIFNVADLWALIGVCLILLDLLIMDDNPPSPTPE